MRHQELDVRSALVARLETHLIAAHPPAYYLLSINCDAIPGGSIKYLSDENEIESVTGNVANYAVLIMHVCPV